MSVDIVIPVLDEEKILKEKSAYYSALKDHARIIFVDGGSADNTVGTARSYGEVIKAPRGRGLQKNLGAKHVRSENILFLHVDSFLDFKALKDVSSHLNNGAAAGCFTMRIDDKRTIFRIYERIVNFRARRFGIIDGDLGFFIKRGVFESIGGFDNLPIMEDLLIAKKLRPKINITMLDKTIHVSSRRWKEKGFLKTYFCYTLAYIKLWTGILRPVE